MKDNKIEGDTKELINSALSGDKLAENKLFTNLHARFLSVAQHRIWNPQKDSSEINRNAEDIVQETLEVIFKNYKQVKFSAGFLQYAFGVLRNKIGDYFRKQRKEDTVKIPLDGNDFSDDENLDNNIYASELRESILSSISKLGLESQKIILALMEGYTAGGMIGMLGNLPRGTLDSKLFRVRRQLKNLLKKGGYNV